MTEQLVENRTTYLTFELGDELFALEVGFVREVLDLGKVTRVPRLPDYMRGVINLRGSVVPVLDMRKKLGMEAVEDTVNTCIIVVEVLIDGEQTVMGALVDSVKAVFELGEEDIEPPPGFGTDLDARHILGMGKNGDGFLIILDIAHVFSTVTFSGAVEQQGWALLEEKAEVESPAAK